MSQTYQCSPLSWGKQHYLPYSVPKRKGHVSFLPDKVSGSNNTLFTFISLSAFSLQLNVHNRLSSSGGKDRLAQRKVLINRFFGQNVTGENLGTTQGFSCFRNIAWQGLILLGTTVWREQGLLSSQEGGGS